MVVGKTTWRKSSHSGGNGGECVEVADLAGTIGVRDSKDPEGGQLNISRGALRALLAELKRT